MTAAAATQRGGTAPQDERRPSEGVPVWDPPSPREPKQSWRDRLGLGKKEADPNPPYRRPATGAAPAAAAAGSPGVGATAARSAPSPTNPARAEQVRPDAAPISAPRSSAPPAPVAGGPAPSARTTGGAPSPQPNPGPTASRTAPRSPEARTFGPPASGPAAMPQPGPTAGPSTTGGGGSAPPLYRTAQPLTAPTQPVAPGAPGAGAPGARPTAGATAAQTTGPDALATGKPKAGIARRTRKARLRLSRLDPWSVMKTSFLFSIAAGIMLVVATYAVWTVLSTSGLFPAINEIVASVVSTPGDTTPFRIEEYINTSKVLGVAALIACVDVVIFTALATLGSFLYNLAATVLGGLEITLAED